MKPIVEKTLDNYLHPTVLLDYKHKSIQKLIAEKGWGHLDTKEKIRTVYSFVKDEIVFGYNSGDEIPASRVLYEGYGQCNTKATLLMALLRAVGVPCRFHGFTIDKALQKGAITGIWYRLAPQNILHSWVEVLHDGYWYNLEGVILDKKYLQELQQKFAGKNKNLCGYGVYTADFLNPRVEWEENDTYIQEQGINQDFGLFDSPDEFYPQYGQELGIFKRWLYRSWVRHRMNRNVKKIRGCKSSKGGK